MSSSPPPPPPHAATAIDPAHRSPSERRLTTRPVFMMDASPNNCSGSFVTGGSTVDQALSARRSEVAHSALYFVASRMYVRNVRLVGALLAVLGSALTAYSVHAAFEKKRPLDLAFGVLAPLALL